MGPFRIDRSRRKKISSNTITEIDLLLEVLILILILQ